MTVDVDRNLLTPCFQLQLVGFVSFRPDEPLKYAEGFIEMYSRRNHSSIRNITKLTTVVYKCYTCRLLS